MKKHSLLFLAVITLILAPGFSDDSYAQSAQSNAPFVEGQIVVKADVASLSGYEILKVLPHSGLAVVRVERGREWAQVQRFKERGFKAGLNRIFMKSETPNDPLFAYQWHFKNVKAEEAWSISTGAGVTIAVLDTGLNNIGAEDGIGCVESGWDIVNDDNDPLDKDGHGTHVSGTIAQATNNEIGVAGLAYNACIMPVKVLDDNGSGTSADIAEGIYWAVDHGAQVINMSLGYNARYGMTNEESIDPALDDAFGAGVTVVCAAGNDGSRRNVSYPAIYPTTIAVGATDYSNQVTRYSNKGTGLDIVAPGGNLSADLNSDGYADGVLQETFVEEEFSYWFYQGTSMASPHVAAVAALLIPELCMFP